MRVVIQLMEAGLRTEGIPTLNLWESILETFAGSDPKRVHKPTVKPQTIYDILGNVDFVPPTLAKSSGRGKLVIFEDNEAVIKMTIKRRAPALRHVSRVHRVDLDWLVDMIANDPSIRIRYVGTKQQIADIFTKGSFTEKTWKDLCRLAQVGPPYTPIRSQTETKQIGQKEISSKHVGF